MAIAASLPPLILIGVAKLDVISGTPDGGLASASLLNLRLLLGTRFDPLRAVVHWNDRLALQDGAVDHAHGEPTAAVDVRPRSARAAILFFLCGTCVIAVLQPSWFLGEW
ncbi:hypothetical protein [Cellulomonas sp. PhB150]|uniref:hypothetical protein n=1 Tax=Cellulomonas sp. PhB150 TaxID=2485188 RepID=UPI000F46ED7F|nr:hypothetical protein [Cellulomonas sp. PhB150]